MKLPAVTIDNKPIAFVPGTALFVSHSVAPALTDHANRRAIQRMQLAGANWCAFAVPRREFRYIVEALLQSRGFGAHAALAVKKKSRVTVRGSRSVRPNT